jgi:deoxyribodipyrimidine photo-lyase
MKIFLINNNLRYKNNLLLEEACKDGGLIIYLSMRYGENSNKYIWESYNLLNLQKQLPIKILYFDGEVELINFLINLEDKNFEIYGDIYFIREFQLIVNIYKQKDKDKSFNLQDYPEKFFEKINTLNIEYNIIKSNLLIDTYEYTKEYKVYTAFKNNFINTIGKFNIIEEYNFKKITNNNYKEYFLENRLKDLPLYDFQENFPIGEEAAYKRWEDFKDSLKDYEVNRNIPALNNTSKLSPYINSGIISVEIMYNELLNINSAHTLVFKQELLWREFAYHTYYYNPSMIYNSLNEKFENIPWKYNEDNPPYDKWTKGETGFMMVDAGMRELNTSGYMFNRCRMLVASFLIKNLQIHWYIGAAYFMEKLLDGDYVINSFNWQWVNGSGRDAAPYFRIFNPILQLEKFDKDLVYVGKYLNLKTYERDYPTIIDFQKSREEILDLYKKYIKEEK